VCHKVIAAIILAAGSSKRLGQPKQLIEIGGETLLQRAVSKALGATLDPVLVVVNNASLIEPLQTMGVQVLINYRHLEGMATSILAGVRWCSSNNVSGVVIMACDQPAVTSEHLLELTKYPEITSGSGYAGKIGIPAYFPAAAFGDLLKLQGDSGARDILRTARTVVAEDLQLDVDTEQDLTRARELFG
jgi:molybdenum cofactor cytidylyltransferase